MERVLHRWFGFAAALLFILIAVTGIGLQVDRWINQPPDRAPLPAAKPLSSPASGALADEAVARLRRERPSFTLDEIDLSDGPQGPQVVLRSGGRLGASLIYDRRGLRDGPKPINPRWHELLRNLHAGYLAGTAGEAVSAFAGLALLLLGVTGLILHVRVWRRRWRLGRRNPFWR